jgi:hypothetical protein
MDTRTSELRWLLNTRKCTFVFVFYLNCVSDMWNSSQVLLIHSAAKILNYLNGCKTVLH